HRACSLGVMDLEDNSGTGWNLLCRPGFPGCGIHPRSEAPQYPSQLLKCSVAGVGRKLTTVIVDRHIGFHAHQETVAVEDRFSFHLFAQLLDPLLRHAVLRRTILPRRLNKREDVMHGVAVAGSG